MLTIGIDLGDKWSHVCVLDESGEVIERGRVLTQPASLQQRFGGLPGALVAIEAGTHSAWAEKVLSAAGHTVLVANSRRVRLISQSSSKFDEIDAERLARLARVEPRLLAPIRHRQGAVREHLAILKARDGLVRIRTGLINQVRGVVKAFGMRLKECGTTVFHVRAPEQIPEELKPALLPLLDTIRDLSQRIHDYELVIKRVAREHYPETVLLQQVAGVGPLTSMCFVMVIDDPARFSSSRSLGAYLGLRPRRRQSGECDPNMRISKAGDTLLRRLLVGSAHYILGPFGPDCDLRRWGLSMAAKGDKRARKRSLVAVARKLAVLLHRLWVTGEMYEPFRNSAGRAKPVHAA
ncbi:MAG: IS110 family transposase [Candidatus Polarisedimenticolia bacterium]